MYKKGALKMKIRMDEATLNRDDVVSVKVEFADGTYYRKYLDENGKMFIEWLERKEEN